jgi:anti-sigma factor RsiW
MARAEGLSCKELVELVTEYFDNSLPAAERAHFEAHLALCPGCMTYLEQMRLTVHTLGKLSEDSLDKPTRDTLLALFRAWKRGDLSL